MSIRAFDAVCKLSRFDLPRPPAKHGTERDVRLVLFVLAHHANDSDGLAWPSRNTLALEAGLRRDVVSHCLVALSDAGLIVDSGLTVGRGVRVWRVLPNRWELDKPASPVDNEAPDKPACPDDRTDHRTDVRTDHRTSPPVPNRTVTEHENRAHDSDTTQACPRCTAYNPTRCPIRDPGDECLLQGQVIDMNAHRPRTDPFGKVPHLKASTA